MDIPLLIRSAVDPSIIAYIDEGTQRGIKLTVSARPYRGEHGVGSIFSNPTSECWVACDRSDDEAKRAYRSFRKHGKKPVLFPL